MGKRNTTQRVLKEARADNSRLTMEWSKASAKLKDADTEVRHLRQENANLISQVELMQGQIDRLERFLAFSETLLTHALVVEQKGSRG